MAKQPTQPEGDKQTDRQTDGEREDTVRYDNIPMAKQPTQPGQN